MNPLTVAYGRSGKARMVLDCRHINLYLFKFKHKYEDASTARDMFSQGDYVITFDLKSAYHHIRIFPEHTTYLGFSWVICGKTRYFVYRVLPFGLATAGFIFTKVAKHFVKYIREKGHKLVMYLDDGLAGASSESDVRKLSEVIRKDLEDFGFLIANEKCCWSPSQQALWLGLCWDFTTGKVRISEDRIRRVLILMRDLLHRICQGQYLVSVKLLACIAGQIMSCKCVIGDEVQFNSRHMFFCIQSRASWNAKVKVTYGVVKEIRFWIENIDALNAAGTDFSVVSDNSPTDLVLFSDASEIGYGGYVTHDTQVNYTENQSVVTEIDIVRLDLLRQQGQGTINRSIISGSWSDHESVKSSTWRELEALNRVIQNNVDSLSGKRIGVVSDNKNVSRILKVGSKKEDLHDISEVVKHVCIRNEIDIVPIWVRRDQNQTADMLSRYPDKDDLSINDEYFQTCNTLFGPYEVDAFATHYNKKCLIFYSKVWCPGTSGIDAFDFSWSNAKLWIVPPPKLISRALNKCHKDKTEATFVIPLWVSAPFWPIVCQYRKFLKGTLSFSPNDAVVCGRHKRGIFSIRPLSFTMIAMHYNFS